jgi:putative ABC transport system permease protein
VTVVGAFAGLAVLLAGLGVYGVMALSVTQRTREIGVRTALGASKANVIALVLKEGLILVLFGTAAGLAGAFAAARLVSSFLFGISPYDLRTFSFVLLVLAMVTLLACLLPARRALRIEPMQALREE